MQSVCWRLIDPPPLGATRPRVSGRNIPPRGAITNTHNCGGAAQNSVTVPSEWLLSVLAHTLGSRERHNPRQERTDLRGVQDARLWVQERLSSAYTM